MPKFGFIILVGVNSAKPQLTITVGDSGFGCERLKACLRVEAGCQMAHSQGCWLPSLLGLSTGAHDTAACFPTSQGLREKER